MERYHRVETRYRERVKERYRESKREGERDTERETERENEFISKCKVHTQFTDNAYINRNRLGHNRSLMMTKS